MFIRIRRNPQDGKYGGSVSYKGNTVNIPTIYDKRSDLRAQLIRASALLVRQ